MMLAIKDYLIATHQIIIKQEFINLILFSIRAIPPATTNIAFSIQLIDSNLFIDRILTHDRVRIDLSNPNSIQQLDNFIYEQLHSVTNNYG
jgi:hypothetical protein